MLDNQADKSVVTRLEAKLGEWRARLGANYRWVRKTARARIAQWPSLGSARLALFALIAFIFVALVYLAQSSNAALVARDLRVKQLQIQEIQRENAQLRYEIAALAAPSAVEQRARKLGLGPAKRVVYVEMPWIQPAPNELMPAFLPPSQVVTSPTTFDVPRTTVLEQLFAMLGLSSLSDRASAQTK